MAKIVIEIDDSDWDEVSQKYAQMTESTNDALDCLKDTIECVFGSQAVISMHLEPRAKVCAGDSTVVTDLMTLQRERVYNA